MLPYCISSPERRWRAAAAPLIAGVIGWILSESVHLAVRRTAWPGLPLSARIILTSISVVVGIVFAVLIMRTSLVVTAEGLADHRLFKVARIPWGQIASFGVERPQGLWGGFCVTVVTRDGATIDLLSTRAYSRIPSARHLDELHRISWTLEQAAAAWRGSTTPH